MRTDIHIAGVTTTQVWSMSTKRGFSVTRRITLVMKVLYLAVRCRIICCQQGCGREPYKDPTANIPANPTFC